MRIQKGTWSRLGRQCVTLSTIAATLVFSASASGAAKRTSCAPLLKFTRTDALVKTVEETFAKNWISLAAIRQMAATAKAGQKPAHPLINQSLHSDRYGYKRAFTATLDADEKKYGPLDLEELAKRLEDFALAQEKIAKVKDKTEKDAKVFFYPRRVLDFKYDFQNGIKPFATPDGRIFLLALNPYDQQLQIWNLADTSSVKTIPPTADHWGFLSVGFDISGQPVVPRKTPEGVDLFSVETAQLIRKVPFEIPAEENSKFMIFNTRAGGLYYAGCIDRKSLVIIDLMNPQNRQTVEVSCHSESELQLISADKDNEFLMTRTRDEAYVLIKIESDLMTPHSAVPFLNMQNQMYQDGVPYRTRDGRIHLLVNEYPNHRTGGVEKSRLLSVELPSKLNPTVSAPREILKRHYSFQPQEPKLGMHNGTMWLVKPLENHKNATLQDILIPLEPHDPVDLSARVPDIWDQNLPRSPILVNGEGRSFLLLPHLGQTTNSEAYDLEAPEAVRAIGVYGASSEMIEIRTHDGRETGLVIIPSHTQSAHVVDLFMRPQQTEIAP